MTRIIKSFPLLQQQKLTNWYEKKLDLFKSRPVQVSTSAASLKCIIGSIKQDMQSR